MRNMLVAALTAVELFLLPAVITAALLALALTTAAQLAVTFVTQPRIALALDDGSRRVDALPPRPDSSTAHRLRHHLQYMECEAAAVAYRRADPTFFGSRLLRTIFIPSPTDALPPGLLALCDRSMTFWAQVDHYGWKRPPKPLGYTPTLDPLATPSDVERLCPREHSADPFPRAYRWQASAACLAARRTENCDRSLFPRQCAAYAAAPLSAKPYKPRYGWGTYSLYSLGLAALSADALRTTAQALGWLAPAFFLALAWRRSRQVALLVLPVAPLGWWSMADFGLWSPETALPQLCAWTAGCIALAARRRALLWLALCGALQAWLWLHDTAEALGLGLVLLAAYATARPLGERRALLGGLRLACAYGLGFVLGALLPVALRHVAYELLLAPAQPELSGYVASNLLHQLGSRAATGGRFVAEGLGPFGLPYFLAFTWGQLTAIGTVPALYLHAACWLALAAHGCTYLVRPLKRRFLPARPLPLPWGATATALLALAALAAEVVPWNDDWVRLGRATILLPAAVWFAIAAHLNRPPACA